MNKLKLFLKCLLVIIIIGIVYYIGKETHFDGRWWAEKQYNEYIAEKNDQIYPSKSTQTSNKSLTPSKEEIENLNKNLPFKVKEGVLWTTVDYDHENKIQTFTYKYLDNINESQINNTNLESYKNEMAKVLRKSPNLDRILNGLIYKYVYYSKDNHKLYEIILSKDDLEI